MESNIPAKRVADSEVEQVQAIMPNHLNGAGRVFGGQLAAWIDVVGGIVARRHSNRNVTTAAIDNLNLKKRFMRTVQSSCMGKSPTSGVPLWKCASIVLWKASPGSANL